MANLSDRKPTDRFHGLIYGDSGSGKTHLIGTFPDPYIVDTDYGLEVLAGKDIEYDEYYVRADEAAARTTWPAILAKADEYLEDPPHETFAVDSLTTLMDVAAAYVLGKAGRTTLQLQDYSSIYDEMTKLLVKLRRMPCNVLVTAHEEVTRDENTGKIIIRPLVLGKSFGPKLPIFFNNIYNAIVDVPKIKTKQTERYLLVNSDGTRIAKTQVETEDTRIEKAYESIISHLKGETE